MKQALKRKTEEQPTDMVLLPPNLQWKEQQNLLRHQNILTSKNFETRRQKQYNEN